MSKHRQHLVVVFIVISIMMFTLEFDYVTGCPFLARPNEMESSF